MDFILYEQNGSVATITINREKALNALNSQVLDELNATLDTVNLDEVRCLILTGAGQKSFVAGADIGEMSTLTKAEGEAFGKKGNDVFRKLETFPIPVIAAVNGFALGGGCEISMSCDIRICSDNAVFGQPEVGLGITPGFGGTQRLARLVSPGMAKQLIYTAKNIKADEAYRIGLVNAVYPLDELLPAAEKMARPSPRTPPSPSAPARRPSTRAWRQRWTTPWSSRRSCSAAASRPPIRSRACPPSLKSASTTPIRTSKLINRRQPDD